MNLLIAAAVIFALLVIGELMLLKTKAHNEFTRKFIHISVGSFVAFFPYLLIHSQIVLISAAFLLAVVVSKKFNLLKSIHNVPRPTDGEFWFALTVLIFALLQISPPIFTVSLLVMSLADGVAAILGTPYGKGNQYKVLGATKSVVGTAGFFAVSLVLLTGYSLLTVGPSLTFWYLPICLLASALENVSYRGIDNITVPLATAFLLTII